MDARTSDNKIWDEKRTVETKYGPWTAHNFNLGQEAFTIQNQVVGDEVKLRRVLQVVADICDRPIGDLRVLDLACLEGMYGIEFSRQGARVCAIEGRDVNLEKARFAARVLSLDNIEFHQDDVRNLCEAKYGTFDVVLCLGILYHLDTPDIFKFLESIFAVCRRITVIDTAISLSPERTFFHNGKRYWGKTVPEHAAEASPKERQKNLWASLDNPTSAYLTKPSLYGLLYDIGYTSAYECHIPQEPQKPADRVTFVAIKGTAVPPLGCPQLPSAYARELPEESTRAAIRSSLKLAGKLLPHEAKRVVKKVLSFG